MGSKDMFEHHRKPLLRGISFLTFVAVLFAPFYHRFLHKFHLSIEVGDEDEGGRRLRFG